MKVLIAGCGYVGSALGVALAREGHAVWGLRRRFAAPSAGIRPIEADLNVPGCLADLPEGLEAVFYLAGPGGPDEALYRAAYVNGLGNLLTALEAQGQRPRRIFFASSTAVYAQARGEWVDESSATEPKHFSGRRLLEGEALLAACPFAASVVRFGGIYGPQRTRLIERVRTANARYHPGHYTNRIHRDDCVGALRHLLAVEAQPATYLAVDGEPASEEVVYKWLAGALGAPPPQKAQADDPPARAGNKRCRNTRLVETGYQFVHPSYREGYTALLAG